MASRGDFYFCPGTEFEIFWVKFEQCCPFSLAREDETSNSAGEIIL
jgi:hypothetical protein